MLKKHEIPNVRYRKNPSRKKVLGSSLFWMGRYENLPVIGWHGLIVARATRHHLTAITHTIKRRIYSLEIFYYPLGIQF